MKIIFLLFFLVMIFACHSPKDQIARLEQKVDSLQNKLADTYAPGFGEFMSNIQAHHIKLWFAGQNQNWELADFEVHEIMESLEAIRKYQSERKESKLTTMLDPALDSVNNAIAGKDRARFTNSYTLLTNTCNNCHRDNDFGFNVVKIPETQPFSNQEFKKPD